MTSKSNNLQKYEVVVIMYLLEGNVKCENCCCGLPDLLNPPEDEVDHPGELLALLLRQQPRRAPTCCQDGHTVTHHTWPLQIS